MNARDVVARVFAGAGDAMLSPADRALVLARQGGRCPDCGGELGAAVIYGHVVPRRDGGSHEIENRVALHERCEARRNAEGR